LKETLQHRTVNNNRMLSLMEPPTAIMAKTLNLMAVDTVGEEASLHPLRGVMAVTKNAADLHLEEEALQAVDLQVAEVHAVVAQRHKLLWMTTEILTQIPLLKSISQPWKGSQAIMSWEKSLENSEILKRSWSANTIAS
jgi:hypothetical protein